MRTVVIGLLGTTLDALKGRGDRWQQWRPTVDLCRQQDLVIDRLELLRQKRFQHLCDQVLADIRTVSPETEVRCHDLELTDAWDFEEVYGALHDFARGYAWNTGQEQYLIHITTGTHVAQICEFLLTESRHFPARLIQTGPPKTPGRPGTYSIIDLDLSKYDRIASRFRREQSESRDRALQPRADDARQLRQQGTSLRQGCPGDRARARCARAPASSGSSPAAWARVRTSCAARVTPRRSGAAATARAG